MSRKLSKEKVQNILNGGAEPVFTAEDMATDESKSRALDRGMYWYRQSFSPNTAKEWIADWFVAKGRHDEAQIVGRAGKQHLRLVVPYCRMENRGFQFSAEQQATIENYIKDLVSDARQHAPAEASVSNIQERLPAHTKSIFNFCRNRSIAEINRLNTVLGEATTRRGRPLLGEATTRRGHYSVRPLP